MRVSSIIPRQTGLGYVKFSLYLETKGRREDCRCRDPYVVPFGPRSLSSLHDRDR